MLGGGLERLSVRGPVERPARLLVRAGTERRNAALRQYQAGIEPCA